MKPVPINQSFLTCSVCECMFPQILPQVVLVDTCGAGGEDKPTAVVRDDSNKSTKAGHRSRLVM